MLLFIYFLEIMNMSLTIYQVDAFTNKVFGGNPASVCPLDSWLTDSIMQQIAMENNQAETAFFVKQPDTTYHIRWFTPTVEVDLCGHATLAAAHVLFNELGCSEDVLRFFSHRSGELSVRKDGVFLALDFPVDSLEQVEITKELAECFEGTPKEAYKGKTDYLLVFENEEEILNIIPNLGSIEKLNARGVIVTARGTAVDFVVRFFAPQSGINEDPVTGSAYTTLTPYWKSILKKEEFTAIQLSPRKGHIKCRSNGNRVEIAGEAVLYMAGEIYV